MSIEERRATTKVEQVVIARIIEELRITLANASLMDPDAKE